MMSPGMKGSPIRVWHARRIEIGKMEKRSNQPKMKKPDTSGEVARLFIERKVDFIERLTQLSRNGSLRLKFPSE
jgi:hypothetical protein